jgi:hypothetical protein
VAAGSAPLEFFRARSSLAPKPALAEAAGRLFDYAQFLLDKDENLTKIGNLSGSARELLRQRALELLGGAAAAEPEDDEAGERARDPGPPGDRAGP